MLSNNDTLKLIEKFPNIELSYDKILHKKVHTDLYIAIPKGKKSLLWFTYFNDKNITLLITLNNDKLTNVTCIPYSFSNELSFNTIFYGTIKKKQNNDFFIIEDIFYYKNKNTQELSYKQKLIIIQDIFKYHIKNINFFKNNLIISIAIIRNDFDSILNEINFLSYDVYGIQCRNSYKKNTEGIFKVINRTIEANFKVKALYNQDIYNLYILDEHKKTDILYGVAMINDYKTSVFMNNIFRNIKENKNLDLLEESDDEDFENTNENKYVDLNKTVIMKCIYVDKFKKWKPINISQNNNHIITNKEINIIQKK